MKLLLISLHILDRNRTEIETETGYFASLVSVFRETPRAAGEEEEGGRRLQWGARHRLLRSRQASATNSGPASAAASSRPTIRFSLLSSPFPPNLSLAHSVLHPPRGSHPLIFLFILLCRSAVQRIWLRELPLL